MDVIISNGVVVHTAIMNETIFKTKPGPPVLVPGGSGVKRVDEPER
jgi:hypothetical protein